MPSRHKPLTALPLAAAAAALALGAQPAQAGGPGRWTRVTSGPRGSSLSEVGLARTSDGVLHVAWTRPGGTTQTLFHTPIRPDGSLGATTVINGGRPIGDPALVAPAGTGLRVLYGAIETSPSDPIRDLVTQTSDAAGTAWSAPSSPNQSNLAYQSTISAALDPAGGVWSTWNGTFGVRVRPGVDPLGSLPPTLLTAGCCLYNSNVGVDGVGGAVWAAYDSNVDDGTGIGPGRFVQLIGAGGVPLGAPMRAPGSATRYGGRLNASIPAKSRAPITGRHGAGRVWTAYASGYPSVTRLVLWRIGSPQTIGVARRPSGFRQGTLGMAADPAGRVWVWWVGTDRGGRQRLFARRSDRRVSKLGAVAVLPLPRGALDATVTAGNAQAGRLDVLLDVARSSADIFNWHTQVVPPLTLRGAAHRWGRSVRVALAVTDAGAPVPGATVRLRGGSRTTGASGKVAFTVPRPRRPYRATATASLGGYGGARTTVAVR